MFPYLEEISGAEPPPPVGCCNHIFGVATLSGGDSGWIQAVHETFVSLHSESWVEYERVIKINIKLNAAH